MHKFSDGQGENHDKQKCVEHKVLPQAQRWPDPYSLCFGSSSDTSMLFLRCWGQGWALGELFQKLVTMAPSLLHLPPLNWERKAQKRGLVAHLNDIFLRMYTSQIQDKIIRLLCLFCVCVSSCWDRKKPASNETIPLHNFWFLCLFCPTHHNHTKLSLNPA